VGVAGELLTNGQSPQITQSLVVKHITIVMCVCVYLLSLHRSFNSTITAVFKVVIYFEGVSGSVGGCDGFGCVGCGRDRCSIRDNR